MAKLGLLLLIFLLAFVVRFYNFSDRITFGPEQAISLITSAEYIQTKPSLLGQPNVQRVTSQGHILFSGSLFNYSLVPLLLIFQYNPLPITVYFAVLNIISGIMIFFVGRRFFSFTVGLFAAVLFLFNQQMIDLSLYIWILHYLPLIGLISFALLWQTRKKPNGLYVLYLGLLAGIGFNLEYFYLFTAILIYCLVLWFSKYKVRDSLLYFLGAIIGNLPMILFDITHQFYHFTTLWQFAMDTFHLPGQSKISPYHFYQYWPILSLFGGYLLSRLYKKQKYLVIFLLFAYISIILFSPGISFQRATGMPDGLTLSKVEQAAQTIALDKPTNFNVASLFDFDSRAHPLRYFLIYKYKLTPNGVENYKESNILYVFTTKDYNFNKAIAYETNVFPKDKISVLKNIDQTYTVFRIMR